MRVFGHEMLGLAVAATIALMACATTERRAGGGSLIEIVYLDPDEHGATAEDAAAVAEPIAVPTDPMHPTDPTDPSDEPGIDDLPAEDPELDGPAERPPVKAGVLAGSHPIMRERAVMLVERLAAEGIHVKLLMGYTPYSPRKRTGPGGWASWHEFGLAFDLNLAKRKSLADAKKHFAADAKIWKRVGAIAEELGLVWGGSWRSTYDPFHFEWHPGHDSVINKDDLRQFLKLAGRRGKHYQKVWTLYEPKGSQTSTK